MDLEGGEGEQRGYVVRYAAEQILNWRVARVNGRNVVTLVVLRENVEDDQPKGKTDEFEAEMVNQLRVVKLEEIPSSDPQVQSQCRYVVELWRRKEAKSRGTKVGWEKVETRIPLRLGKPLTLIPFVFDGPRHSLPDVDKLPLADIIAINLDHYRLNADYKHGLHFTALPTAWVSGFDKAANLRIGSSTALSLTRHRFLWVVMSLPTRHIFASGLDQQTSRSTLRPSRLVV